jgi:hypothetical protein
VEGSPFDEAGFFRAIAASGAKALLIGRRARVALGIPVLTAEEESRSLIRWFRRRYPTPADRLAYVRRAYRRTATPARP